MVQNVSKVSESLPVSVIIPCYRCAETIDRAINSVLNQTKLPKEIILVDDFSNDDFKTLNCLLAQINKHKKCDVRVLELKENNGPGTARNEAWDIATQPYIAFLDADDSWHPEKLSIQYTWMVKNPEVYLTAHSSKHIYDNEPLPKLTENISVTKTSQLKFLFKNFYPTRSVMLRRDINYRFCPGKRYAEDYLLWLSIVLDGHPSFYIHLPMAYSYKHEYGEAGLTSNLFKLHSGVVDTYRQVLNQKKISLILYCLLVAFSYLKHLRRLATVKLRNLN
jgi:glycosyltransferase involved in cell wall biosynthesis